MNYLIIASILFSLSFGLIKDQLAGLPSDVIVELRLILAGLIFLPFFRKTNLKNILTAGTIGFIQFGLMYMFFLRGFKYLQGSDVALLTAATPMFVAICAMFFGERFKWINFAAIILSIFGAIIAIGDNVSFNYLIKGVIFIELSNLCFALGQVLWRKYLPQDEVNIMTPAYFAAAIVVLPFTVLNTDFNNFSLTLGQVLSIAYLGIVPTGIGFWLWNKGSKMVSASTLAIMNNFKIPLGVLFAWAIFGEKIILLNLLIGGSLILTAIIISQTRVNKSNDD